MKRIVPIFFTFAIFILSFYFSSKQVTVPEKQVINEEEHSGALQALNFWTASRAYPFNDIPSDKYYKAFAYSKRRFKEISRSPFTDYEWQFLGPVNLSGRTIALALNPVNGNTIYAGSASGGLWRSYTGAVGGNWERVTTGFPVLGVNAIAIDPADTNTIYIGTGEVYDYYASIGGTVKRVTRGSYGIGILKTSDNGATWTKCLDWAYNEQHGVQVIKINPLNPNTVWAGTTEGAMKSTDAGITWNNTIGLPIMDLLIHPTDTDKVMITCGDLSFSNGSLLTVDGGANWNGMILPNYTGKAMLGACANTPNTIYASIADDTSGVCSLWRSLDFGLSWSQVCDQNSVNIMGVQGWYSHYVAVHPNDPNTFVYGGVNMMKSTNGGTSFTSVSGTYSDHHTYAIHPINPNILYDANDDGVYRSTNFGTSFSYVGSGLNTGQFYNGFSNSQSDSLISIGQVQDHIPGYKYTGSAYWSRSARDEVGWTAINPSNDNIMFAVSRGGISIGRSTDRGISFPNVISFGYYQAWLSPIAVSQSDPNVVYMGRDKIFKSTTNGESGSWSAMNNGFVLDGNPSLSLAIAPSNSDYVYVGTAPLLYTAHIFRTTNGGNSWQNITGSLPDLYPNDIAVDPVNANIVYVAFGGFLSDHFYKSTNGGGSWSDISTTLPDVPGTAVMVDPLNSNNVFVGNDVGVYISTNGGSSWNSFSDGLPEAVLISDLTYSASNRAIRVTTHGNGIFERKLPSTFPAVSVLAPNGGEIWYGVTEQTITWSSILTGLLKLEYSFDNGSSWNTIAQNIPSSPASYLWTTPPISSTQVRIRVSEMANPATNDMSDDTFTLYFSGTIVTTPQGWGLLSLPFKVNDPHTSILFPDAITSAFSFDGSYSATDSFSIGNGYWLKFPSSHDVIMRGDSIKIDTVNLSTGWNIIGSISTPVLTTSITTEPDSILISPFFGYDHGYLTTSTINPGKGYWIKSSSAGKLIFSTTSVAKLASSPNLDEMFNHITVKDANGNLQKLYFGNNLNSVNLNSYTLPPLPPQGVFDVRFASQRLIESPENVQVSNYQIDLHSISYPITLTWDMLQTDNSWLLNTTELHFSLNGSGTITLKKQSEAKELRLVFSQTEDNQPQQVRLLPNYPNPFNPTTTIRYEIPDVWTRRAVSSSSMNVQLKIFDMLGKEVATLVNEIKTPGEYTTEWNAQNNPSGVYMVQLSTEAITLSQKSLLMK